MIRLAAPDDAAFVSAVGVAAGMFPEGDTTVTDQMMTAYFEHSSRDGHVCLIDESLDPRERIAMAYLEPVRATDGTYELLMIAVDPRHQGKGHGTSLLRHAEQVLRDRGVRLLLVQTSGEAGYANTRRFYVSSGYEQAAHVDDYYAPDVPMVLFRKDLLGAS